MTNEPDWIDWHGGECPVPAETQVEVRFRRGNVLSADAEYWGPPGCNWTHHDNEADIVAFRILDGTPFEQQAAGKDDVAGLLAALKETTEALERDGDPAFAQIIMDNRKIITAHETAPVDPDVRLVADIINAFEDSNYWVENDTVMHERHQASLKRAVEYYRTARTTNTAPVADERN